MASRNFHKNRTKERKARQRAARRALRPKAGHGFTPRYVPPYFAMGQEMSSVAALAMMDRVLPRLFGEKPR